MKFNRFYVILTGILISLSLGAFADDEGYPDAAPPIDDYSTYSPDAEIPPPEVPMDEEIYEE